MGIRLLQGASNPQSESSRRSSSRRKLRSRSFASMTSLSSSPLLRSSARRTQDYYFEPFLQSLDIDDNPRRYAKFSLHKDIADLVCTYSTLLTARSAYAEPRWQKKYSRATVGLARSIC